jgi:two-component system, NtrC family, sensor histidine kinase HydH
LRVSRIIRPQDFFWILLFASLAIYGPDRQPATVAVLLVLCVAQIVEPKIPFFATVPGGVTSFIVKLALCYILIGWTDGVSSPYYWLLLIPVITAATSFGLIGTVISILLACASYLSFLLYLGPQQYIEDVSVFFLRVSILSVIGYLTHQLAESTRTEARRSQAAVDQLAEANRHLEEAEAAARRSERLAALGQLSAGLAHELRNPLGTIKASAEMLTRAVGAGNEVAHEMAHFISTEVDRTDSLITRFLDFARPLAVRLETADITQLLDTAIAEIERRQPPLDVTIYKNYSPEIRPFPFDPELMRSVFYNLLLNAAQASPPKGSITVKTRQLHEMVEVAVIDCGSGIEKKHLENIFNPFFTTKAQGVGLGLAIVSKIVDEHGGKIAVESEAGSGTVFRVYLPCREVAARESAA